MAAEDLLRLAWEAEHDGRRSLRDAMVTLAIAESRPEDDWPERCRARLISERPGHFLGAFSTVREALADPRVIASRDRLRVKYPEARVRWLLLRAGAARGPYTGRVESLDAMIEDLVGVGVAEVENVRLDAPQAARGPLNRPRSLRPAAFSLNYPSMKPWEAQGVAEPPADGSSEWDRLAPGATEFDLDRYLAILFAIAMLLAALPEPSGATRVQPVGPSWGG